MALSIVSAILATVCGNLTPFAEASSFKVTHKFQHEDSITNIAWSPDGRLIATAGLLSGRISIWDVDKRKLLRQLNRVGPYSQSITFSTEGKYLVTSPAESIDGAGLTLWDTQTWEVARYVYGPYAGMRVAYSAARQFSLSSDQTLLAYVGVSAPGVPIALVNARTWETEATVAVDSGPMALSVAPSGKTLAIGTLRGDVVLVDTEAKQPFRTIPAYRGLGVGVNALSYSPDGRLIAVGPTYTRSGRQTPPDPVRIFDESGALIASLSEELGVVRALDWSPDNELLAIAASDGTVRLWHLKTKSISTVAKFSADAFAVRFSPDGRQLASGGRNLVLVGELY